jgi:hypothetical protein
MNKVGMMRNIRALKLPCEALIHLFRIAWLEAIEGCAKRQHFIAVDGKASNRI